MKVKDILESVCLYLDLTDEFAEVFNSGSVSKEVENEYKKLLLAINSVLEDFCYKINLTKTKEEVVFFNKSFDILSLSKKAINIIEVKNQKGKKIRFKIFENRIECDTTFAQITYNYLLEPVKLLEDQILIDNKISLKAFVLGVISQYYYINGLFDDAKIFEEKFLNAVKECVGFNKNFNMPKKRWF